jgi:hypothetical protein
MEILCENCVQSPLKQRFKLWLKFFLAIVLAVGLAVNHGPGVLLLDIPPDEPPGRSQCQTPKKGEDDGRGLQISAAREDDA